MKWFCGVVLLISPLFCWAADLPDTLSERFKTCTANLSLMDGPDIKIGGSVRLKLEITGPEDEYAPYWFFTPVHIRVQDKKGRDVNLFTRPVSSYSGGRHGLFMFPMKERIIDLTSFLLLQRGIEYVHKFEPGEYTATFYFDSETEHIGANVVEYVLSRKFEGRTSNTVSFRILPNDAQPADAPKLLAKAEEAVEKNKPEEAVLLYKQAILNSEDFSLIRHCIFKIMLIREVAQWEDSDKEFMEIFKSAKGKDTEKKWGEATGNGYCQGGFGRLEFWSETWCRRCASWIM